MDDNGSCDHNEGSPRVDQTPDDPERHKGCILSTTGKCELNSYDQEVEKDMEPKSCHSEVPSEASANPSVSTTSSGTVCRICQEGDEDGNSLRETGCSCRGSIRLIHDGCLMNWIRSQRSVICELCHDPFTGDHLEEVLQYWELLNDEELDNNWYSHFLNGDEDYMTRINMQWTNGPMPFCDNSRRFWMLCIVIIVGLSLSSAFIQTTHMNHTYHDRLHMEHEHQIQLTTPSSLDLLLGETGVPPPESEIPDRLVALRSAYNTSLIILGLTCLISAGVLTVWSLAECCIWPLEKYVKTLLRRISHHEVSALHDQVGH